MTTIRHNWLSKETRKATFIDGHEHQSACVCGFVTSWSTSRERTEHTMSLHISEGNRALMPAATAYRRRIEEHLTERVRVNADLKAERLAARGNRIMTFAGVMFIAAALAAVVYFEFFATSSKALVVR